MMAARGDDRSSTAPEAEVPAEVQTQLVHAMLDKQYRALLDDPGPLSLVAELTVLFVYLFPFCSRDKAHLKPALLAVP